MSSYTKYHEKYYKKHKEEINKKMTLVMRKIRKSQKEVMGVVK